jgi:hypothetical protein
MQVLTKYELYKLQNKLDSRGRKRNKNQLRKTVQWKLRKRGCNRT